MRIALVLLAALALRLAFFTGFVIIDDAHYLERAFELAQGELTLPGDHWEARVGLVLPAALSLRLFGLSEASATAFPLACSLAAIYAAYAFGRRLFDERAGLLAAALFAMFPMDVLASTTLMANSAQTLLVGSALGFLLVAERSPGGGRGPLALAGACLGLALVVHETTVMTLVFVPLYFVAAGRPAPRHLWLLAGLAPALALDPLFHGLLGDPAARLHAMLGSATVGSHAGDVRYKGLNLEWLGEPLWRSLTEQELGLFPYLVAPLAAWRLARPAHPVERPLALFVIAVALWTFYGSVSPVRYAPLVRVPRYLAPLVLPAALLLGHELARRRRAARLGALALLAASSLACVVVDGGRGRMPRFRQVYEAVVAEAPSRVIANHEWTKALRVAAAFRPPFEIVEARDGLDPSGAMVVTSSPEEVRALDARGVAARREVVLEPGIYEKLLASPLADVLLRTRNADRRRDLRDRRRLVVYLVTLR